ncbi:M28 family peptidase, partial [Rhodococcus yunnanensis]
MNNVLGMIPGKRTDEYVIVGAHFDHLGIDMALHGDRIYNGADDNASGVSAVLQIARAFLESCQQPERTVIFAFWDGEE